MLGGVVVVAAWMVVVHVVVILWGILEPLGRPGRRFGVDFGGFGGPKWVRKGDFLDPKWKSAK